MKKYMVKLTDDSQLRKLQDEYAYFECSVRKQGNYAVIERYPTQKQRDQIKKAAERIKEKRQERERNTDWDM